jgi:hypothetical protein
VPNEISTKQINSATIRRAAEIACGLGNAIAEIQHGWTKVDEVVVMKLPLSPQVRDEIGALPEVKYAAPFRSPHYPYEDRFICGAERAAISFPADSNSN